MSLIDILIGTMFLLFAGSRLDRSITKMGMSGPHPIERRWDIVQTKMLLVCFASLFIGLYFVFAAVGYATSYPL